MDRYSAALCMTITQILKWIAGGEIVLATALFIVQIRIVNSALVAIIMVMGTVAIISTLVLAIGEWYKDNVWRAMVQGYE